MDVDDGDCHGPCAMMGPSFSSWIPLSLQRCGFGGSDSLSKYVADEDICAEENLNDILARGSLEVALSDKFDEHPPEKISLKESLRTPPRTSVQTQLKRVLDSSSLPDKPLTASEAYRKGKVLQYLSQVRCGSWNFCADDSNTYETKWSGHQPLTPNTWSDFHDIGDDASNQQLTASELRLIRRRRHRGVLTPPRHIKNASKLNSPQLISPPRVLFKHQGNHSVGDFFGENISEPSLAWSIPYPKGVPNPNLGPKRQLNPHEMTPFK